MQWNVITAFILDQLFGYQTANKLRENHLVIVSGRLGRFLGGSRELPNNVCFPPGQQPRSKNPGVGPFDALNYVDVEIDGTNQGGLTIQARVEVRTDRSGCTITPKVRNITTGADAGVGLACAASDPAYGGTNQRQTIALTIVTGINKYRLQYTLSTPNGTTWCTGEIERFATA